MHRSPETLEPAALLALAARVEGDGGYNVAKLLRAAAMARLQRVADGNLSEVPRGEALHDALRVVAAAMADDPLLAPLAAPLTRGTAAFAAGALALIDDVADPRVCRRCGHVVAGEPFEACPHCGADEATYRVQRPVWWLDRYDPRSAQETLAHTPAKLQALLERLPESAWPDRPDAATWSPHEVVAHLRDAQDVLEQRIEAILGQDDPDLEAQMVWAWNAGERPASTPGVLAAYLASRQRVLLRLAGAPADAWWRTGRHREFGRLTLTQQVSYFAAHEPTHLRQVRAAVRRYEGRGG
jgi:hypothetical protein